MVGTTMTDSTEGRENEDGTQMQPEPRLSSDYRDGWREGITAVLRGFMGRDSGGYVETRDKNGQLEQFLPVGFLIDVVKDARAHPEPPILKHDDKLDGRREQGTF
jgi:hypothetical protein